LVSFENLTPQERTQAKNKEAARVTVAKIENRRNFEIEKNAIKKGMDDELIAEITELSIEQIQELRKDIA